MAADLNRGTIVDAIRKALEPLPFIDALVEGGAAAWGRIDAWSDIDLNVFVQEGTFDEAFRAVEESLRTLSPIEHTFVAHWPAEGGMQQKFYRLSRADPFLVVDLAVLTPSATEKFLEPELHGDSVVYFDKTGVTKVPRLDRREFDRKLWERLATLRDQTEMFHVFVEKEMNRGNWIEAISEYRAYVVGPLLEALRMKHGPLHHRFRTRYVHYELPGEVVEHLQSLLYVRDADDLRKKYAEGLRWFREVAAEVG